MAFGFLLANFSELRLIQVIQGSAVVTIALNILALWKQEARDPTRTSSSGLRPTFAKSWSGYMHQGARSKRRLAVIGIGTAAFSMEDILLEPYGGQILRLPVGDAAIWHILSPPLMVWTAPPQRHQSAKTWSPERHKEGGRP